MTTQLRSVGVENEAFEQASHPLSGGFMHTGRACGLLTGAVLAAGVRARDRFDDDDTATAATLFTAVRLARTYPDLSGSENCREITGIDLTTLGGRLRYMRTGSGKRCGHLHLKWGSQANGLIEESFGEFDDHGSATACANCAVATLRKVARRIGIEERDAVLVAGLAGGVGLLGNVCGSLSAGVFGLSLSRYNDHAGQPRDSWLRGGLHELTGSSYDGEPTKVRLAFIDRFGSDLCLDIVGRRFTNGDDHSDFMTDDGCREVVNFVVQQVEESLSAESRS